jgi:hypothetical protein
MSQCDREKKVHSVVLERTANCLALFDWQGELGSLKWIDLAQQFFAEAEFQPLTCVYRSQGKEKKLKLSTLIDRIRSGLCPEAISLLSTIPPHNDFGKWAAKASMTQDEFGKSATFSCDARGLEMELGWFVELTQRMASLVSLQYGFAYQRPFSKGPGYYAHGIGYGRSDREEDSEELSRVGLWLIERRYGKDPQKGLKLYGHLPFRHLDGMQRDVYPLNILTSKHLSRQIEGVSLEEWIGAGKEKGWLQPISNGVWGWIVPEGSLLSVRHALEAAGLLIARPHKT